VPNLPPGNDSVKVEANGFKPSLAKGVVVLSNRTVRADVALETGAVLQTIEVQATAPVVNSETSAISSALESRAIVNLPLNAVDSTSWCFSVPESRNWTMRTIRGSAVGP
jgi:hypothetical protein